MQEYFNKFKRYAFRLELLQRYDIPEEEGDISEFVNKGRLSKKHDVWYDVISNARKRGAIMQRVHVVELPLTNYLKFEMEAYKFNVNEGEEVYIISKENLDLCEFEGGEINFDFWLFDDEVVLKMNYDADGKFLGFEKIEGDILKFVDIKNKLIKESNLLKEFFARKI